MKFASYRVGVKPAWGMVSADGAGLIDVSGTIEERYPTLESAIVDEALGEVGAALAARAADRLVDETEMEPVLPKPGKILCIGLNYDEHRKEGGHPERGEPTIFVRFANSQMGHNQPMVKPKESEKLDYEAELAVIIGKAGRRIPESAAMEYVAGYAPYNDGSVRDWQRHTGQYTPGKNFMNTGGFGPWMSTPDEIEDLDSAIVESRLNGEVMQHATVADMIFPIPKLIAYISTFTELEAGDVIVTGTPGGVGSRRDPQIFMKGGDVIEIEIGGVGVLRNPVIDEE